MRLSKEQELFCTRALNGNNILVEACIGSGKTTSIQALCNRIPINKKILYLTYNKLLKVDAKSKIKNKNATVTNYHGFVYPYLKRAGIKCGVGESVRRFLKAELAIKMYDIIIVDEYQDIELEFALLLEYIKSTNPSIQIILVGDMAQKIYDKTSLKVEDWVDGFLGEHMKMEFTQCFRLNSNLAGMLGSIWEKQIVGVNNNCSVRKMNEKQAFNYIAGKEPGDVLCLGQKAGTSSTVLNRLEEKYPYKWNKNTVYASIRERDANVEPGKDTAIFTTYDSSKGLEKPVCVVFDWDYGYWETRNKQSDSKKSIMRNIFCVAASRGKDEIVFVESGKNKILVQKDFKSKIGKMRKSKLYVSDMFDFRYTEELDKAMHMLTLKKISTDEEEEDIIDVKDSDGMIDLSPCIGIYQELMFFDSYNIDLDLEVIYSKRKYKTPEDIKSKEDEYKILNIVAMETKQNRYYTQVDVPFVSKKDTKRIIDRIKVHLTSKEEVQVKSTYKLGKTEIIGICDVLKDNVVWELKFTHSLKREHFLQVAMYLVMMEKEEGVLWNVRNNEMYIVSLEDSKREEFLKQVNTIISKK